MTEKVMCPQCRLLFPEEDCTLWGHKPLVGLVCPDCMVASLAPGREPHTFSTKDTVRDVNQRIRDWLQAGQPIPAEPTPLVKAWAVQAQVSGPGMPLGMIAWGVFAEDEARARAVFLDDARFEAKAQGMSEAQQKGLRVLITRVQHMPSWESFGMVTARVALMRAGGPKGKMGGAPKSL